MTLAKLSKPQATVIEAFVENCNAEVYLNDIPVGRIFGDGVRSSELGITVNDYVAQGVNTLEIVVEPGDTPSVARKTRALKVSAGDLPDYIERVTGRYLEQRAEGEGFAAWAHRADEEELR